MAQHRSFICWTTACLLVLPAGVPFAADLGPDAGAGIELYNQEHYQPAREKFLSAQRAKPDLPEIAYNLGNSNYRLGRYEDAVEAFSRAFEQSTDPGLKQKALYNRGNAYYRLGALDLAIASYQEALKLDPGDRDSKYNLEFARQQWERARQGNRIAPRDMSQEKNNPSGPNPPRPGEPGGPEKPPEAGPSAPDEETRTPEPPAQPETPPRADREPHAPPASGGGANAEDESLTAEALHQITSMTPEEAEQWLESLNEDIKTFSRRQMQGDLQDVFVNNRKDW